MADIYYYPVILSTLSWRGKIKILLNSNIMERKKLHSLFLDGHYYTYT